MAVPDAPSSQSIPSQEGQQPVSIMGRVGVYGASNNQQHHYNTPGYWSYTPVSVPPQASPESSGNHDLHTPLMIHSLQCSTPPRNWEPPKQLGPTPWEATEQQAHNPYPDLDPQLSRYVYNGGNNNSMYSTDFGPSFGGFEGPESGYSTSPGQDELPSSANDHTASQTPTLVAPNQTGKHRGRYAKLIHQALLSAPRHAMTLHEIYQWFCEHTETGERPNKWWKRSIRRNLSTNHAFNKRERRSSADLAGENGQTDKKLTEWYLETWALTGVESKRYPHGPAQQHQPQRLRVSSHAPQHRIILPRAEAAAASCAVPRASLR
ncbi:uncharacterized protein C8A04DRAFT_33464 [Dichotomopilus funicola]|uniref:Fork-head domain-containing protein n=1 Tax=Dichotomopilus funicola TaxID=1934379 RepID=A0AAN6UUJ7_9PEZI|nr:hypothetical protein C8A04DRAFT_33464 [Dichotomopilus funicola]